MAMIHFIDFTEIQLARRANARLVRRLTLTVLIAGHVLVAAVLYLWF